MSITTRCLGATAALAFAAALIGAVQPAQASAEETSIQPRVSGYA